MTASRFEPGVSVVIPAYNCARWIANAVESAVGQRVEGLEILVVDDGSTDGTLEALRPFEARIRYIRKKNGGAASARNLGLREARRGVVAFLDADDRWSTDKLAIQLACLDRLPGVGLVFSDFAWADEDGRIVRESAIREKYGVFGRAFESLEEVLPGRSALDAPAGEGEDVSVIHGPAFPSLFLGNYVNTSSVVVDRRRIEGFGPFDESLSTEEDYDCWLRASLRAEFAYVSRPLLATTRRSGQLTGSGRGLVVAENVVRVLEKHASEARVRLGRRVVAGRLADRRRALGLALLGAGRRAEARRAFATATGFRPDALASCALWLWSFVPDGPARAIRRVVRGTGRGGQR